MILEVLLSY